MDCAVKLVQNDNDVEIHFAKAVGGNNTPDPIVGGEGPNQGGAVSPHRWARARMEAKSDKGTANRFS